MSFVNFDVCSTALVMYLLNGVPFPIFVLIRDYCIPLRVEGFPIATTLLSLKNNEKQIEPRQLRYMLVKKLTT